MNRVLVPSSVALFSKVSLAAGSLGVVSIVVVSVVVVSVVVVVVVLGGLVVVIRLALILPARCLHGGSNWITRNYGTK